ncbi:MAG TPA: YHS domain-containing protein, partial [Desulfobacteraceae bacterium]|nr:YHS domain-containing protein [Desulfobacteraceae bacterium]
MTNITHDHTHKHGHKHQDRKAQYVDPVCGMNTADPSAFAPYEHDGKTYYFCSDHCLAKFKSDPDSYTGGDEESSEGSAYTCPMHPEIVQDGPGTCPKCGMALEPVTPAAPTPTTKTEYTCPMHPEIVRAEPGTCPKCGMALEPRAISMEEEEGNPEYDYMRKRFIFGAILTTPLVIIAMRDLIPGGHVLENLISGRALGWLELILATPVVLWA